MWWKIKERLKHEIYAGKSEKTKKLYDLPRESRIIDELDNVELYELGELSSTIQYHSYYNQKFQTLIVKQYFAPINRSRGQKCGESRWQRCLWKAKDVTRAAIKNEKGYYHNQVARAWAVQRIEADPRMDWGVLQIFGLPQDDWYWVHSHVETKTQIRKYYYTGLCYKRSSRWTYEQKKWLQTFYSRSHKYSTRARKTKFLYSEEWNTKQRPFDEELQAKLRWLNQDWRTYFAQSSSSSSSSQNWWQQEHQHQDSQWHGPQDVQQRDHQWQNHRWQDHGWSEDLACNWKQLARVPSTDQQDYRWKDRKSWLCRFLYSKFRVRARDGWWRQKTSSHAHFFQSCRSQHAHARALLNHARMCGSSLHICDWLVMFGVVCSIAHQTPLHPWCLIPIFSVFILKFFSFCSSATSENTPYAFGEGIADRNQDPFTRHSVGGTVWLSGRLLPSHVSVHAHKHTPAPAPHLTHTTRHTHTRPLPYSHRARAAKDNALAVHTEHAHTFRHTHKHTRTQAQGKTHTHGQTDRQTDTQWKTRIKQVTLVQSTWDLHCTLESNIFVFFQVRHASWNMSREKTTGTAGEIARLAPFPWLVASGVRPGLQKTTRRSLEQLTNSRLSYP